MMRSFQCKGWREGTPNVHLYTTRIAFTQTHDLHVGQSVCGAALPSPLQFTSPPIPETCITQIVPFSQDVQRKSVFNLWAIYNGNRPYKMYTNV